MSGAKRHSPTSSSWRGAQLKKAQGQLYILHNFQCGDGPHCTI